MTYSGAPSWAELLLHLSVVILIAAGAGIAARFGARRPRTVWGLVLLVLAFFPLAIILNILVFAGQTDRVRGSLYAPPLLAFPLAGLLLYRRPSPFRRSLAAALLIGVPVALSLLCLAASWSSNRSASAIAREERRRASIVAWHQTEQRLRHCVAVLRDRSGESDAQTDFGKGDRRLYVAFSYGQEDQFMFLPGLQSDQGGSTDGPYGFVAGRTVNDRRTFSYGVKRLPVGELWTDPWYKESEAMGRPPDSAQTCARVTRLYIEDYNREMLRLGPLKKPFVVPRVPDLPRLPGSQINNPGLYQGLYSESPLAQYLATLRLPLEVLGARHNVLTRADIDRELERTLAQARAAYRSGILMYDRDGDGVVTALEVENAPASPGDTRGRDLFARLDKDQNGRIESPDIEKAAYAEVAAHAYPLSVIALLLRRDPDGNGQLTKGELDALGTAVFGRYDLDGDGVLSRKEYEKTQFLVATAAVQEEKEADAVWRQAAVSAESTR